MKTTIYLLTILLSSSLSSLQADERPNCSVALKQAEPVKLVMATASAYANFRNKENSVRYQTNSLLQEAIKKAEKNSEIVAFVSRPHQFLKTHDDHSYCAELSKELKKTPITFFKSDFDSLEAFQTWFSDFTQGKGEEGKKVYSLCDRACSPSYQSLINVSKTKTLQALTTATCGPPRDKDDNQYKISYSLISNCELKDSDS